MENCNLILGILIISAMLYIIILNNPTKEHYRNSMTKSDKNCAPRRSLETLTYARMLEKRGTILKEDGKSCYIDLDCNSRYCNNNVCSPLCESKTGLSNLSDFSRR